MGTDIDRSQSSVPALYDPASSIDADDIEFPRLYIAQATHQFVQDGLAKSGALVLASGGDDPDPVILAQPGDSKGVDLHILSLRKSKSDSVDGELVRYNFDDPDVPPTAWTVYTYFVALPGVEDDVPVKWILTRSGKPAAQKMNTVLARAAGSAPPFMTAFNLTTAERRDAAKGHRWFVPRVKPIEPSEDAVAVAGKLFDLVNRSGAASRQDTEPAI